MADLPGALAVALADRYRLERQLGQGGMATVYLAEDLKHNRKVAIKVLKPELAAVLGAERFVQEIATTAQLQHPNILPLFDSGSADTFLYYVMPYVEGETLRARLDRETQLGVDEAVKLVVEVADALQYAHEHGVVHRDIKPENILLHAGRPMVADFGIALAVSAAAGGRMTETGLSLGTPHYMSPEQATAEKTITARSDTYSLASVLYEMLAGQPPHLGGSAQQIIMKIIAEDAQPVTALRKSVPPWVSAALSRALEKVPADRFASAREFAEALQGRGGGTTIALPAGGVGGAPARLMRRPLVPGLAAALVLALGFGLVQWRAAHRDDSLGVVRFNIPLPPTILVGNAAQGTNIAVSPDGRTLAYTADQGAGTSVIYVRRLDESAGRPLAGTEGAQQPCFSPDGQWVAYVVGNRVWKAPINGGVPALVGPTDATAVGLTWSAAGLILAGAPSGLLALPANGGSPRVVAVPDSANRELYFNQPRALPDGETVLFGIQTGGGISSTHLGAASLRTGKVTRFDVSLVDAIGLVDGRVIYVLSTGALMASRIDLKAGKVLGDPVALGPTILVKIAGASEAAMTANGVLIYVPANAEGTVGWVDPVGEFTQALPDARDYSYPRLSPDGRQVAVTIGTGGRTDIWAYTLALATPTRITDGGTFNERPEWTPDGRRILWRVDGGNGGIRSGIWWRPADLSEPATGLQASAEHDFYEAVFAPDGRTLVYQLDDAYANQADVMYRSLAGDTTSHPIAATTAIEAQARISPDGKWVAYVSDASGTVQVVVRPLPGPGGVVQISNAGGSEPVWAPDGRHLYYRDGRHFIAASVTTTPDFAVTGRSELFADHYQFAAAPHANYDVAPDGRRFLMIRPSAVPDLHVVLNWLPELRARLQ